MFRLLSCLVLLASALASTPPGSLEEAAQRLELLKTQYQQVARSNKELSARLDSCEKKSVAQAKNTPIAFTATSSVDRNIGGGQRLVFDSVSVNEGEGYSTSDNAFTPTLAGWYLFTVSVISNRNANCFYGLVQNSNFIMQAMSDEAGNYASSTITVTAYVPVGQSVWVQAQSGGCQFSTIYGRPHFSGVLIDV